MNTERFQALASQILQNAGVNPDPGVRPIEQSERAAHAIRDYFATGFEYSLEAEPVPGSLDPTEWFLFSRKAGHCEYYASAMVMLCRSIGINTRVVTGYVATEFNDATGHYLVRQSNAHAWVEAEVGPGVWRTFDPTPSADFQRVHEPSQSLIARMGRLFDAAEYAWIRSVVGFDSDRQRNLVRSAFKRDWSPDQSLENFAAELRKGGVKAVLQLAALLMFAVVGLAIFSLIVSKYRGVIVARISILLESVLLYLRPRTDLNAIYLRFLRELARRGCPKPIGVPLLTHVLRTSQDWPGEERDAAERLSRSLYQSRFHGTNDRLLDQCAIDLDVIRR